MAPKQIQVRMIEKFVMLEFANGNLNTQQEISCMISLIKKKLGITTESAANLMRDIFGEIR